MLETKLAKQLEKILGLQELKRWDAVGWGDEGTGCLGLELERVLKRRVSCNSRTSPVMGTASGRVC